MIAWAHHLREERLLDCYFAERAGEMVDPRMAEHIADCKDCGERYAAIGRFLDSLRTEADLESAALFTPERLRLQQQQIAARLEHIGQPAHVLSFPTRVGRHMTAATRVAPRWVVAAAAAGLFVGIGAGLFFDTDADGIHFRRSAPPAEAVASRSTGVEAVPVESGPIGPSSVEPAPVSVADQSAPQTLDDEDVFLSELELALESPRTHELLPFDALTPRVREVSNMIR